MTRPLTIVGHADANPDRAWSRALTVADEHQQPYRGRTLNLRDAAKVYGIEPPAVQSWSLADKLAALLKVAGCAFTVAVFGWIAFSLFVVAFTVHP